MNKFSIFLITLFTLFVISCDLDNSSDEVKQEIELPNYEILDKINMMGGGVFADVLIESYSQNTPADSIETSLREISRIIEADEIFLYCSKEAQRANYSASFAESHPDASSCFLGTFKNGSFQK